MARFTGIIGIIVILALAYLWSNNRKAINYRLVLTGLGLQLALAIFILKVPIGQEIFYWLGKAINKLLDFSQEGGLFVFGDLTKVSQIPASHYRFRWCFFIHTYPYDHIRLCPCCHGLSCRTDAEGCSSSCPFCPLGHAG